MKPPGPITPTYESTKHHGSDDVNTTDRSTTNENAPETLLKAPSEVGPMIERAYREGWDDCAGQGLPDERTLLERDWRRSVAREMSLSHLPYRTRPPAGAPAERLATHLDEAHDMISRLCHVVGAAHYDLVKEAVRMVNDHAALRSSPAEAPRRHQEGTTEEDADEATLRRVLDDKYHGRVCGLFAYEALDRLAERTYRDAWIAARQVVFAARAVRSTFNLSDTTSFPNAMDEIVRRLDAYDQRSHEDAPTTQQPQAGDNDKDNA